MTHQAMAAPGQAPDPEEPTGLARELTDLVTGLVAVLPGFLGIDVAVGVLLLVIVLPALWPLFLSEDLVTWPRQQGWKRTAILYLCFFAGLAIGYELLHLVLQHVVLTWQLLLALYVVPAMVFAQEARRSYKIVWPATIFGTIWFALLAAYLMQ